MKTKVKTVCAQYRQGDVMIERVESIPASAKLVPLEQNKVILAHGEVTGHHHAFAAMDAEKFTDESGGEFFKVKGRRIAGRYPITRIWRNQVMVDHPEHGIVEFAARDVAIEGSTVVVNGDYGLLKHDEHHAHGVPAGVYKGAGATGSVHQREYSPEEIRRVAD